MAAVPVSSLSDAIIRVDEVLDAANGLPLDARRLLAAALRERNPYYCWVIEKSGRLTCNHGSSVRLFPAARGPILTRHRLNKKP